jgi:tripartite-type tricarboxylate transporter receptor subunit TctC
MRKGTWLAAVALTLAGLAQAQYPSQPIKLIVPWPPGGGVDTSARLTSLPLATRLGQPVVIENKPGAGGNVGTEGFIRANPDGYTLLMASVSPNAINPNIYLSKLPFDPIKDFTPVILVASVPNVLVVPANSPFNSVADIVKAAKERPGKLNYGSAGVGSSQHLAAELFKSLAGNLNIVHVPYKGTSAAETDLIAGHIDVLLDTTTCLPFIAAGKMKALAVASKQRNPALPNVPTFDELGIPGVYSGAWYGYMGPANMPKEIVAKLNAELNAVLKTDDMKKKMADFGAEVGGGTPEDFGNFVAAEIKRYGPIVKMAGVKFE